MVAGSAFQEASGNGEIGRAEEVEEIEDVMAWQEEEVEEYEYEKEDGGEEEEEEEVAGASAQVLPRALYVICLTEPHNASFIHGTTGHQVCCIGCAEKLKKDKKGCPVYRQKIKMVIKNFF